MRSMAAKVVPSVHIHSDLIYEIVYRMDSLSVPGMRTCRAGLRRKAALRGAGWQELLV